MAYMLRGLYQGRVVTGFCLRFCRGANRLTAVAQISRARADGVNKFGVKLQW